jgi:hypothetical protein
MLGRRKRSRSSASAAIARQRRSRFAGCDQLVEGAAFCIRLDEESPYRCRLSDIEISTPTALADRIVIAMATNSASDYVRSHSGVRRAIRPEIVDRHLARTSALVESASELQACGALLICYRHRTTRQNKYVAGMDTWIR